MNFNQAISYLDDSLDFGIKQGTKRIIALLKKLGDPQQRYHSIIVTGTNGKTSTTKMIGAILSQTGLKVGVYTSPHLYSYCERIEVNGAQISQEELVALVDEIKPIIKEVNVELKDSLSNFEIVTALTFYYFAKKDIEVAVLEVGMGGRWDATNIADAKVAVITNVTLDHTNILGETIAEIAREKSYVIKEGSQAVVGSLEPEAMRVVSNRVKDVKANLIVEGEVSDDYMAQNKALAISAAEFYLQKSLDNNSINQALKDLTIIARRELIGLNPTIIVDGSHNEDGARQLIKSIKQDFTYKKAILIISVYKDKDYLNVAKVFKDFADLSIITQNNSERAQETSVLAQAFICSDFIAEPSIKNAIEIARKKATADDLILITGSFATAAEARLCLLE
ncbi:MAG: bifunctional folylpolyglutamate synthase/dihydrofolate synthase [Actinobacteria bacterium]|nr:MAG: bifunctional folylpolyglutamate synthase/dihydrofolate synthase [Actinomycetota bacterium]